MLAPRPLAGLFKLLALTLVVVVAALVGCSGDDSPIATDAGPYGNAIYCPGVARCGDTCVDTRLDPQHCGACDHACADGQVCSAGQCASSCPDSLIACDGGCIDPLTHGAFCGASGRCTGASSGQACGAGQVCVAGTCQNTDATLASLTFSSGTLSPAFSPATTAYVLEASSLLDLRVTATPTTPSATLKLNGAPLAAGSPSERIAREGAFPVLVLQVTAPGGSTAVYTVVLLGTTGAYAKASNTGANDEFGSSVALSGDTLAVGAPYESSGAKGINGDQNNDSASQSGAVYVFTRSGTTWSQQAYIKASNTGAGDHFGSSVALDGDTLVVGAPNESSSATGVNNDQNNDSGRRSGAVYVFTRSGTTWSQQAYIKASNTGENDFFGTSVALSGDTLAVGAPGEDSSATGVNGDETIDAAWSSGAVYVFTRSGSTWSQQAYIKASNAGEQDQFGASVTLSGDTLAVGAPGEASNAKGINGDQTNNSASSAGAAYVFTRSGTTWSQQAYIKASNTGQLDRFGSDVALSGDTLAVGAGLEDSNATGVNGDQTNDSAEDSGAAYVFTRSGTTWSQQAYLKASNTRGSGQFGLKLALSGDTLAVVARGESSNATGVGGDQANTLAPWSGAAYVFTRSGTTWTQFAYVKASNTEAGDLFGSSVALSGDDLVVGASKESSKATGIDGDRADNSAEYSGAVYVF